MGIMVYSLLWVMQDFDHQPYDGRTNPLDIAALKEYLKSYRALDCSEPLNPLTPGP